MLVLLTPRTAHAYLDAGTASMLFQGFVAAVMGVILLVKIYWRRIKTALGMAPMQTDDPEDDDAS